MRKYVLTAAACLSLAACDGAVGGGPMLANGAPAFEGFTEEAVKKDAPIPERNEHQIVYNSDGSMKDVFEFYRDHYSQKEGHKLFSSLLGYRSEKPDFGGYVQVFDEGDLTMVHVSPKKGSGTFDLTTNLGDGFPVYPGVAAEDYDVRPRSNGSRMVIFRTKDEPMDILGFYASAAQEAGYTLLRAGYDSSSNTEKVRVNLNATSQGTTTSVLRRDLTKEAAE